MGACIVLVPVVVAAWPVFASAVASAAVSLGYAHLANGQKETVATSSAKVVELEVANSEVVTGQLGRDQKIVVARDGVTVIFHRDARGKAALTVSGEGHPEETLRAMGEELSRRVVRDYVHRQILAEMESRNFVMVEETVDENNAIHMTVRQWEN